MDLRMVPNVLSGLVLALVLLCGPIFLNLAAAIDLSRSVQSPLKNRLTKRAPNNPLMQCSARFHSFVRALLPNLGIAQLEKAITNISAKTELVANSTADTLGKLQTEINSFKEVVFQNRMVLDMVTAQLGGVYTLINTAN